MANAKRKCTFTNEMQENINVLEKAGMITKQNAWFANQEPIYLSCTKIMVI